MTALPPVPDVLYGYRIRDAGHGETDWHPYPLWPDGSPQLYLVNPGPLHCDARYEVQVIEYRMTAHVCSYSHGHRGCGCDGDLRRFL